MSTKNAIPETKFWSEVLYDCEVQSFDDIVEVVAQEMWYRTAEGARYQAEIDEAWTAGDVDRLALIAEDAMIAAQWQAARVGAALSWAIAARDVGSRDIDALIHAALTHAGIVEADPAELSPYKARGRRASDARDHARLEGLSPGPGSSSPVADAHSAVTTGASTQGDAEDTDVS